MFVVACSNPRDEEARRQFVVTFVKSVYDDSAFYREHLIEQHATETDNARKMMSANFEIVHEDITSMAEWPATGFEFYLKFSNGASGVAWVQEKGRTRRAGLRVQRY